MKICFMCDLHLPFDKGALQYDLLNWAITDLKERRPDCVAYAGDVTCDGNEEVYDFFIEAMSKVDIPFIYIPGNSDLRCEESRESIKTKASNCRNTVKGVTVFAINDCDNSVSDEQLELLETADGDSVVFMHHPIKNHIGESRDRLLSWREAHKDSALFFGHLHLSYSDRNSFSLQAMDPDKAIGECPCITYYDTDTRRLDKVYYSSPIPNDIYGYFGISCYDTIGQIEFATERGLKNLELRPNCLKADREELKNAVSRWRALGGQNLSIHLPDVAWSEGGVSVGGNYDGLVELVAELKADRVTQHVPQISVGQVKRDPRSLDAICEFIGEKLKRVSHRIVIGVENMHMTSKERPDDTRRFGYIPEECLSFMEALDSKTEHRVGINFDVGHARNNAPYSQKYQTSTWLSMIGKHIVGYHLHQVTLTNGVFENHMPITDVYGQLISYASFFKYWSEGRINKAPVVFEMRPERAYETTLMTFEKYKIQT